MKLPYKPLPAVAPNNVTLLLGETIGTNIDASLSHAKELLSQRNLSGSVLYINTVQNVRSMNESARKHGLRPDDNGVCTLDPRHIIYLLTVERGDLYRWRNEIKEYLASGYIQYVVINSWEYAGKNSRYREEAVFLFKELTNGLEGGHPPVNLLVYAEDNEREVSAQKIRRSGFGKLTGIARRVENITVKQQFEEESEVWEQSEVRSLMSEVGEGKSWEITNGELRIANNEGVSEVRSLKSEVGEWKSGEITNGELRITNKSKVSEESQKEELITEAATSDLEVHFAPVFVPTSDIGRRNSDLLRSPIHLNNLAPDKSPNSMPKIKFKGMNGKGKSAKVHSDVLKK